MNAFVHVVGSYRPPTGRSSPGSNRPARLKLRTDPFERSKLEIGDRVNVFVEQIAARRAAMTAPRA
jgi:hypothetical protein